MLEPFATPTPAKPARALIRPISQVTVKLLPRRNQTAQERFDATVDQVLRWLEKKSGRSLPSEAWQRSSFDLSEIGAPRAAAVALAEPRSWAARLDDDDQSVLQRDWITEVGVRLDSRGAVQFGTRLICATRGDNAPFDRSIPGFAKQILRAGPAELDGELIHKTPRIIASEADVDALLALLERPERIADVVVLSLPVGSEDPSQTAIPAERFLQQTLGAAHVVVLTGRASFLLSDRVGRELSTFQQAVRTYRSGFKRCVDEASRHPLALAQRIAAWNEKGPLAFAPWLVNQVLWNTVRGYEREQRLPSFNFVRQQAAQKERSQARPAGDSDTDLVQLERDNEALRTSLQEQKQEYDDLLKLAEDERNAAEQKAEAAKEQAFKLRQRVCALEQQLAQSPGRQDVPIPQELDEFESWCEEQLAGALVMTPRAIQGVRKSTYEDPALIYRALLLLKEYYVPMRIHGGDDRKQAYDQALASLHLKEEHTGNATKCNGDQYSVQYAGHRKVLVRHLKKGNAHNPRHCFRLYFFWDDESQLVVVGWLPSHLDNKVT
ncbi:hypothetical protein D5041_20560 [Verminephrobacter aporrectodeae subsp. tuberculatae]|uniref:hypothetical protein n=1 Tax=Verminephrobacter aporrectodeae TaxID=1110389 RepID=UPI002237A10F|nr:hypothetical protein [Verminephrobacter aporrectodeae]MCW5222038.1 hypothetical protein [Verminephrobacter aporrectodeae subsp. tuberculatae]MCW5291329.1 hypothetical protein [Verminephrobacter aporrectodeae subsp. tuberculatae]